MDLQTFFKIGSYQVPNNEEAVLLWEIGSNYSLLSLWSDDVKSCHHVQVDMFDELEMEKNIREISVHYQEANLKFRKVVICSAFPNALLVPRKFFSQDSNLLDLVDEGGAGSQFYDFAGQWQLVNLYSFPASLLNIIKDQFPSASFRHVYTPSLKAQNEVEAMEQIHIHIVNKQFRVIVKKDNNLLLIQTYEFTSPMDVIYYLLKICQEFEMNQEEIHLTLSGFIENESVLYKEIYQYFSNISFAQHAAVEMPEHQYPEHYFTSLHNLAACVS